MSFGRIQRRQRFEAVISRTFRSVDVICFANVCRIFQPQQKINFLPRKKPPPAFKASWSCMKERMVDALALRADERRDKLRKASGRSKYPLIRRYLNGETRRRGPPSLHTESIGMQGEPGELKHLSSRRKRKKHRFPK